MTEWKKIRILLILISVLAGFGFANGDQESSDDGTLKIGAIYLDAQGYYAGVRAGVQNRAESKGLEISVIETNARGDVSKESSFMNTLTVAGVDAMIISAVSSDGSARAVKKAAEAGIPVICYNTCVNEETMASSVYAYAVGDPYEFGRKIGAAAADYIKANNIENPQIGIINCEQYEVCITRRKGFEAALEDANISGWSIVANQEGTELDKAISTGEQIHSANPDSDIRWGESGGASLGAAIAVRNTGNVGKVAVFASDMTTEIAKELESYDVMKGVVDISGKTMGSLALDLALDAINGKELNNVTVQAPIDLYLSSEQAKGWLETHPDGLP